MGLANSAPEAASNSADRRRKRSKAAVIAMAARRIEQLQQSASLSFAHTAFFRATALQVLVFSPSSRRCVDANDAFCHFTGYSYSQLVHSRLALCIAPIRHMTGRDEVVEQWEVDELGRTVPVPPEQTRHNWAQLGLLLAGEKRKVLCTFRVALSGQRLTESQCECWLSGQWPMPAPEVCTATERLIVVQTSPDRYRSIR